MKKWVVILISIILLILDNSLMPFIAIRGAFPSLLFIFAISYSLINGGSQAVKIGVLSGFLQDIFFYNGMGINLLSNFLLCVFAGIVGSNILKNKKFIPVLTTFIVSILKILLVYLFIRISGGEININIAFLSALYNMVIMYFGYKSVLKLCDEDNMRSLWRFR